jgi:hypothetical protein
LSNDPPLLAGKITEHIRDYVLITLNLIPGSNWPSNAHPQAGKILISQSRDNGINPIMSPGAATTTEADFAQGKVKVIVNDEKVIRSHVKSTHQPADRLTTQVHKGLGPG